MIANWLTSCESRSLSITNNIETLALFSPHDGSHWIARRGQKGESEAQARLQREQTYIGELAKATQCFLPNTVWQTGEIYLVYRVAHQMHSLETATVGGSIVSFLDTAIACSEQLGHWHSTGIVHGDICDEHILADENLNILLVAPLTSNQPVSSHNGAAIYRAPELEQGTVKSTQADLYALGVSFFRLLTGAHPFQSTTSDFRHNHAAILPFSAHTVRSDVPTQLSLILEKLLAKDPDERYSSAASLRLDLLRCRRELEGQNRISDFILDAAGALAANLSSNVLHGREFELGSLSEALNRFKESGASEVVMLFGRGGVGKTALAQWLLRGGRQIGARIGQGKCDQLSADAPYSVVTQAIRTLVLGALSESQERLARLAQSWERRLDGQVEAITSLVPEAALILSDTHIAEGASSPQNQSRIVLALLRTLEAFSDFDVPVALLLDDLQWADESSLTFLDAFIANPPKNVLLIGTNRNSDESFASRYSQAKHATRSANLKFTDLVVEALPVSAYFDMVSASLHTAKNQLDGLVKILHGKSGGNPYFARQLLRSWLDDGVLTRSESGDEWVWSEEGLKSGEYAEHIVDFVVQRMSRYPDAQKAVLNNLALIGIRCDLDVLSEACELNAAEFDHAIGELTENGLLYKNQGYAQFQHDRALEAAYALTPLDERSENHLRIARVMMTHWHSELEEHAYEIANQIERSSIDASTSKERISFVRILLMAARRARRASAVDKAYAYSVVATGLMDSTWWEKHFSLAYATSMLEAECLLSKADLNEAARKIETLLARSLPPAERTSVHRLEAVLLTLRSDYEGAIEAALAGLDILDIPLRRFPSTKEMKDAFDAVLTALNGKRISDLGRLPICEDQQIQSAMALLSSLSSSFFVADDISFTHLAKMVEITLRHGAVPESPHGLAWFGVFIAARFDEVEIGYQFALAALSMVEYRGYEAARIATLVALDQVSVWTQPLNVSIAYAKEAVTRGISSGDIGMACYACNHIVSDMLAMGESLPLVYEAAERGIALTRSVGYLDIELLIDAQRSYAEVLIKGYPSSDKKKWGEWVHSRANGTNSLITRYFVWLHAGMTAAYRQEWEEALLFLGYCYNLIWLAPAHISLADCYLYRALSIARNSQSHSQLIISTLQEECSRFEVWTARNPSTFQNKLLLLQAELSRMNGDAIRALCLYDSSARLAELSGFPQEQALAHELAAELCRTNSLMSSAANHDRLARTAYLRWGAADKALSITTAGSIIQEQADRTHQLESSPVLDSEALQLSLKVAQTLSTESVKGRLVEKLMSDLLVHAGAQYGLLLRIHDEGPLIEASARVSELGIVTSIDVVEPNANVIPLALLNIAIRTKQPVVLYDAATDALSVHIERKQVGDLRSVLCLPLLRGGEMLGIVYLENNLAPGVFDAARVMRLELMAPQIAIALESATLYEKLITAGEARSEAERNLHSARAELVKNAHVTVLANLAASIAHEVNQPLGAIVTSSEAALRWLNRPDPQIQRAQSALERTRTEGLRAAEIVRAMRALAHQSPPLIEKVSVAELILDVINLLNEEFIENDVRLITGLTTDAYIEGDRVQLQQVILNLLNNAVESMTAANSIRRELTVKNYVGGNHVVISIQDCGPGIDNASIEHIFDPFFTTKSSGLGMGLAICRTIIEAHGGSLNATNNEGGGAVFSIELPQLQA